MMNNPASDLMTETPALAQVKVGLRLEGRFDWYAGMNWTKDDTETWIDAAKRTTLAQKCCVMRRIS